MRPPVLLPSGDDILPEERSLASEDVRDASAISLVDATDVAANADVKDQYPRFEKRNASLERPGNYASYVNDLARPSGGCQPGETGKDVGLKKEGSGKDVLDVQLPSESFSSAISTLNVNDACATSNATGCSSACARNPATGVMSVCGRRREMEDFVTVAHRFVHLPCKVVGGCLSLPSAAENTDVPFHFFGVYDGHGGSQAANFCKDRLHLALVEEVRSLFDADNTNTDSAAKFWEEKWEKVMSTTFLRIDAEIEGLAWRRSADGQVGVMERLSDPIAPETVGCTAVVAVVGSCQIIIANCGDSRAVLSRGGRAIDLSVDHKPNREDEMSRIEALGGRVICWNGYRVFGMLAMSRAIGDRYMKPYVIAEPEVKCLSRSEDDECLILATDGLWDVLSSGEACEAARKRLASRSTSHASMNSSAAAAGSRMENAEAAAVLLTKMALAQGSNDNISVVVVDLKNRDRF